MRSRILIAVFLLVGVLAAGAVASQRIPEILTAPMGRRVSDRAHLDRIDDRAGARALHAR